jgi:serine/threonine protein phosphatase PrpC/CRP-like cAMP-binding protein
MEVQFWAATDVGRVREHNEDNFLVDKRLNLFVVCDGMGGHSAGEVASAIAVRAIRDVVANNRDILDRCGADSNDARMRREVLKLLEYAVQEACTRIFDMAQANPERRGMGTTCSMLAVIGRRCFIAHVGDSRIYLYRKGQAHQLTEDHTLANEMLRRGRAKDQQAMANKYKNAITRAVGVYESVEVDTLDFDTLPGDNFLLCSDGLSGYLEEIEGLNALLRPLDPRKPPTQEELKRITTGLVDYANGRGGKDNVTAVLVALSEDTDDIETEDIRLTMETIRNIPIFHYLSYKELVRVVNVTRRRVAQEGDFLLREGEEGEELFVIMRGSFLVERGGVEIARLGAGRHFGEMALIDDRPRSASVRCVSPGALLTIHRRDFYDLLRDDAALAVKLLWNFIQTLSARLREVNPSPALARRFHDASTGSAMLPPSVMTQEIEALAHPEASTLSGDEGGEREMLSELESLSTITGEEITLPGVKVEDGALSQRGALNYGLGEPSGRRRHSRHDAARRSSALDALSKLMSGRDEGDKPRGSDD